MKKYLSDKMVGGYYSLKTVDMFLDEGVDAEFIYNLGLSGVGKLIEADQALWYQRKLEVKPLVGAGVVALRRGGPRGDGLGEWQGDRETYRRPHAVFLDIPPMETELRCLH